MVSFGVRLSLKTKGKDRLELCLSSGSRLILTFFFALSCFIFLASSLSTGTATSNIIPFLLFIVTGLGALYEETWIYDKNRNLFENRFGLLLLHRKWSLPLDDLAGVEIEAFTKGHLEDLQKRPDPADGSMDSDRPLHSLLRPSPGPIAYRIIRLTIVDKQGKVHVLDSTKAYRIEEFRRTGRRIAEFCGVPFGED